MQVGLTGQGGNRCVDHVLVLQPVTCRTGVVHGDLPQQTHVGTGTEPTFSLTADLDPVGSSSALLHRVQHLGRK